MKIQANRKDTIWSFLGTGLSVSVSIIILPFILKYLNDDDTAVYYIFTSLSALTVMFDLGFSPSIARSMTYAWSGVENLNKYGVTVTKKDEPNFGLIAKIIKTCKVIYTCLASFALILALTIGTYYINYITHNLNGRQYIISWIIYALALFLNLLYSYYSVFLRGIGAVSEINIATVVSRLVQMVACVAFVVLGFGLLGVAISYLLYGILFRLIAKKMFYKKSNMKSMIKPYSAQIGLSDVRQVLDKIWPNTWRDGIVTLSSYLLNQATTIIASLFLTLTQTGIFSLSVQLINVISTISTTLYTTLQPSLQSAYATNDVNSQKKSLSMILMSFYLLFFLGMIAVYIVGIPVANWLKPSYKIDKIIILFIGIYQFLLKRRDCYCSYISTTNRLIYTRSFLVSALICISLSYLFLSFFNMQVYGLIAAQLLSQLVFNAWFWSRFVKRELNLSAKEIVVSGISGLLSLMRR